MRFEFHRAGRVEVAGDVQLDIKVVGLAAGAGRRVRQRRGWLRHARRRLAVESDPRVGPMRLCEIETGELPDGAALHHKLLARLLLHGTATIAQGHGLKVTILLASDHVG